MATDLKELADAAQDQTIKAVEALQASLLDAAEGVLSTFNTMVPSSMRPVQPAGLNLGEAAGVPNAQDAVKALFDFTERVLQGQRAFAERLLAVGTPAAPAKKSK